MRILVVYPGHSFSTIDIADGYTAALKRLGHTVDTFGYHNILSFYHTAVTAWMEVNPKWDAPDNWYQVLASERLAVQVIDFVPDVVLVVSGMALNPRAYELLRRLQVPVAVILTESPYLDEVQGKMLDFAKPGIVFTNEKNSVDSLNGRAGIVHYLPHSYDPLRHHSKPGNRPEYHTDIFFHGTLWPERQRLFSVLKMENDRYRMRLGGLSFGGRQSAENGVIDNKNMAWWYSNTAVALNHHRTVQEGGENGESHIAAGDAWSLGPRAYEIAACGAFQLCDNTRGELRQVFGDSVATYEPDPDHLREQIDFYMSRPELRREMAQAAQTAVKDCTFDNRAQRIVEPALMAL